MPFIAVLNSVRERATLADTLAELATVRVCEGAEELVALGAAADCVAAVAGLRDAGGASTVLALLALQNRREPVPIIIVFSLVSGEVPAVMHMMKAGLQATLVIRGFESVEAAVERVVTDRAETGPAAVLLRSVVPMVGAPLRRFFAFGAIVAARPITVRETARVLGVAERTLESQLRRSGMPPPHRVLGWYRVLHAAWELDVLGRAPKQVAAGLQFPSMPALYNQFRHYAAPTPAAVREQQGFPKLLRQFTSELGADREAS